MQRGLVGSEMCIRDSINAEYMGSHGEIKDPLHLTKKNRINKSTEISREEQSGRKGASKLRVQMGMYKEVQVTYTIDESLTWVIKGERLMQGAVLEEIDTSKRTKSNCSGQDYSCLLYTSDAADDTPCVDLGGRRIIKKKNKNKKNQNIQKKA
eukprot:TRINITY_DN54569_c0_g1_i1.p2 TRINITY_DN54569_c0_g1~~TRINITY_DN54569_c0_g1_i1.p2  ORF type:complete len:153 (-),score=17.35 TRINITY_DN54569_c0_g1_i1:69-527(-)